MSIGSLFSGIGGLELGLEWAGLGPVIWQCERDPYCREVLARHWPGVPRYDDVRTLTAADVAVPTVICGGFPCQDISAANPHGQGLDGARSGLWFEYRRIVEEIRPGAVVVENVGRLARRGLDVVAQGLSDLGYQVEVTRIFAADVGAPHLRERCFIVGVANGDGEGQPQPGGAVGAERGRLGDGGAGLGLADGSSQRRPEPGGELDSAGRPESDGERQSLGDRNSSGRKGGEVAWRARADAPAQQGGGRRPPEPRVGGVPDGLPHWVDGPGPGGAWPSPRGAAPGAWEPQRTAQGVPMRPARLRALGNAVVPQVAHVVGLRLRERLVVQR